MRSFARLIPSALLCLALIVTAQPAGASHVRPKGATPFTASLVPAYNQCTAPNNNHGSPLAYQSCSPPVQSSNFLTVGTPDANGAPVGMVGSVEFHVKGTSPEDVLIDFSVTDVRCAPATDAAVCNSANAADGPDYTGNLSFGMTQRASDHYNGASLNDAATVVDLPGYFLGRVNAGCEATADTTTGSTCSISTTQNAIVSGSVKDAAREVLELDQLSVTDGGADGQFDTPDNTLFLVQGVFVP
jgi:hypothetical protein